MNAVVAISKALARLHRWHATALVLSRTPLASLDHYSVGRLRYALMMTHRTDAAKATHLFEFIVRRNAGASAEMLIELAAMATTIAQPARANQLLTQAEQASTDGFTTEVAQRLRALNIAAMDGSLNHWVAARVDAMHLPSGQPLTLAPMSSRYSDMGELWVRQVRRHVGGHIVVMAMDATASLDRLTAQPDIALVNVREWFAWNERGGLHTKSRGVLWYLRVLFLRELVQRGHPVLVLDLDAMPVSDLAPMLAALPASDVVAQKDHSLPVDVDRQLGFVLCCGFMLWRPTVAAKSLLDRFAAETFIERDDQMALNHLLARDGIVAKTKSAQCMQFGSAGVQFVCPDPSLVSRSLTSGSVVRHFHQKGQTITELRAALGIES